MNKKIIVCVALLGGAFGYLYAFTTIENKVDTYTGYDQAEPKAHIHVGAETLNRSVDCQILISRLVDNAISGNGHAYSDSSHVTRTGSIGYNSYDARPEFAGTANFDHFGAFQARPIHNTTGITGTLRGYHWFPDVWAGTVTKAVGAEFNDPVGAGSVTENIGTLYKLLSKGSSYNYEIFTEGVIGFKEMTNLRDNVYTNSVYIAARNNGGKTELVAVFPTGAVQRIAIEP